MNTILKLEHIQKYYGNEGNITKAIKDISFSVEAGEFLGIMGASGSGKTTLLNCISTIDTVSAGHIFLDGTDITEIKPKSLARFDMYPLYWTTSKEGVFMRYSYEFKLMCVELYHSGSYPDIPEGANPDTLKRHIREWSGLVDLHGPEVLKHKVFNKVWTPEEKLELVLKVIAGIPKRKVATEAGINSGMLYQWVYKYKSQGYNGLVESKKGRPTKESRMKKSTNPLPLTESEREELIRLRAENEYIKAENEVIKKRIALRQEKWAAQLKAKKQQSSKNSEKTDTN